MEAKGPLQIGHIRNIGTRLIFIHSITMCIHQSQQKFHVFFPSSHALLGDQIPPLVPHKLPIQVLEPYSLHFQMVHQLQPAHPKHWSKTLTTKNLALLDLNKNIMQAWHTSISPQVRIFLCWLQLAWSRASSYTIDTACSRWWALEVFVALLSWGVAQTKINFRPEIGQLTTWCEMMR